MTTVSACLIVRNEAELLPACLESLRGHVDEVCVLDTGSTDGTMELARAAGARIEELAWNDDFSAARNASLAMASGDWILVIDADERFDSSSFDGLRAAIEREDKLAFSVDLSDVHQGEKGPWTPLARLFRNGHGIHYQRPVHESIVDSLFAMGTTSLEDSGARLFHLGYHPELVKARSKHSRNLKLMRKRATAAPGDLYNTHKLLMTLPVACTPERSKLAQDATVTLQALTSERRAELPFAAQLLSGIIANHVLAGAFGQAERLLAWAIEAGLYCAELKLQAADIARRIGDFERSAVMLKGLVGGAGIEFDAPSLFAAKCHLSALRLAEDGGERQTDGEYAGALTVDLHCAEIRKLLEIGDRSRAGRELVQVRARHGEQDEVRLLCGEWAWADGQFDVAVAQLRAVAPTSAAGQRAALWLAIAALAHGEVLGLVVNDMASRAWLELSRSRKPLAQWVEPGWRIYSEASLLPWRTRLDRELVRVACSQYTPGK